VVTYHVPVLAEAVERMAAGCRRAADATVGDGGHTERLRALGADVLAVDRDPDALRRARHRLGDTRIRWVEGAFADESVRAEIAAFHPDFILLDLGVSSQQLDDADRGFSFRPGVPLDMRMGNRGPTAADLLASQSQRELARLFREFADERRASRLATVVTRRRRRHPLTVSDDLVNAIREALGPRSGPSDFARIFQAIRMAVNDELGQLRTALSSMREALVPGGRLAVISYHSGEDRVVKHEFREWARSCVCPPGQPVCTCRGRALGRVDPSRPIVPSSEETAVNPRARSAKLRGFVRDATP
jgi:16S rRNA (cytosine1402-N4)-methyltransferase